MRIQRSILVSGAVVVAKSNQRANLKVVGDVFSLRLFSAKVVLNYGRIFALNHEDRFLNLDAMDFVSQNGKRIQTKSCLQFETSGVNNARVLVSRKVVAFLVDRECLFEL